MTTNFGKLTLTNKNIYSTSFALDYIFRNSYYYLKKLTVIEAERHQAVENLRKLTTELQTKRLRYNAKSACKYFTL